MGVVNTTLSPPEPFGMNEERKRHTGDVKEIIKLRKFFTYPLKWIGMKLVSIHTPEKGVRCREDFNTVRRN